MQECAKTAVRLQSCEGLVYVHLVHTTQFLHARRFMCCSYNSKCHDRSLSPEAVEPEVVQLSALPPTVAMPIVPLCTPGSCRDPFTRVQ